MTEPKLNRETGMMKDFNDIGVYQYKNHVIVRTSQRNADNGRELYRIVGHFKKEEGRKPFITSLKQAKAWITDRVEAEFLFPSPCKLSSSPIHTVQADQGLKGPDEHDDQS